MIQVDGRPQIGCRRRTSGATPVWHPERLTDASSKDLGPTSLLPGVAPVARFSARTAGPWLAARPDRRPPPGTDLESGMGGVPTVTRPSARLTAGAERGWVHGLVLPPGGDNRLHVERHRTSIEDPIRSTCPGRRSAVGQPRRCIATPGSKRAALPALRELASSWSRGERRGLADPREGPTRTTCWPPATTLDKIIHLPRPELINVFRGVRTVVSLLVAGPRSKIGGGMIHFPVRRDA